MEPGTATALAFHNLADRYRERYMDLTDYDETYGMFCHQLPPGRARVLDAACGPGNVSRFLRARRPDLDILGLDLAPRMVELARIAVPTAEFRVEDCRRLDALPGKFAGVIAAFLLPYLSPEEAATFVNAAANHLVDDGVLYLSTMLGDPPSSTVHECDTGDRIHVTYHSEEHVRGCVEHAGLQILARMLRPSPATASVATTDLILLARRLG